MDEAPFDILFDRNETKKQSEMDYFGQDGFLEDETAVDGVLFIVIIVLCVFILMMVIRLCYSYTRKFPMLKEPDSRPMEELINKKTITTSTTERGMRYSVA